jgi:hypothetical protein
LEREHGKDGICANSLRCLCQGFTPEIPKMTTAGRAKMEENRAIAAWLPSGPPKYSVARPPVSISDLRARLELLTKYGVRTYRDGILSLDLDPERLRKRTPNPDDQPVVPEM